MLTHMVLISVPADAPDGAVDAIVDGLRALPEQIDAIDTYRVGRDLGLADGNATIGIIATFASPEALQTYIDHPAHQAVVHERIRAVGSTTSRLQFDG